MRKRYIPDEQINQIIKLKQSGASWLKIQNQTGIPRRSAKNAYEEWERNRSFEELKAARVGVATEELKKHIDQLVDTAKSITIGLGIPPTLETTIKSDEQINFIWEQKYTEEAQRLKKREDARERRQYIRECNMLLTSLKDHTVEKIDWGVLDQWKKGWDKCIINLNSFNKRKGYIASKLALKDENKIIDGINKKRNINTAANEIAYAMLKTIWWNIFEDTFNITDPLFNITYDIFDGIIRIPFDRESFESLRVAMQIISTEFCASDIKAKRLIDSVDETNKSIRYLEEMLNPLILRPLILRTRCELCPA